MSFRGTWLGENRAFFPGYGEFYVLAQTVAELQVGQPVEICGHGIVKAVGSRHKGLSGRKADFVIVDDPYEDNNMQRAQFAPVAPIQVLEGLKAAGKLGFYHLLLTHHILEHPEAFKALFADWPDGRPGRFGTIIVDNSLVELKGAASDAMVFKACQIIGRHLEPIPVLADVMGDGEGTRVAATDSYAWWTRDHEEVDGFDLMVVAQGNDWRDFCETVDYFLLNPRFRKISWVGIPRILVKTLGTRERAIHYVRSIRPDIKIHLLGFSDDVPDDIICSRNFGLGIDSAVPLRAHPNWMPSDTLEPRPANWFDKAVINTDMLNNLNRIRGLIEG